MLQLIHWFSGNKEFESADTAALLDALMDGVVSPTDTALRDFSAKCIKEFLKWSLKQKTKKVTVGSVIGGFELCPASAELGHVPLFSISSVLSVFSTCTFPH